MLFFLCILFVWCSSSNGAQGVQLPPNGSIPAVILFGDSIVDQGCNNNLQTIVKCNFPPYGKDFMGGVSTGRFSNAKTPADIIVARLGIKELVPAYLDPNIQNEDILTGVSFASGGMGYDPQTPKIVSALSFSDQLKMFKEYIGKLKELAGKESTDYILSNSLFAVIAGSDDLANTYYIVGLRRLQYDVPSYADLMVSYASDFVQAISELGARRICVFGVPPIGCLPSQRSLAGGAHRNCVETRNQAAQIYNTKLTSKLHSLSQSLPAQSKILYVDIYNPLLDIIQNPQNYGIEIVDKGCCGSGDIEAAFPPLLFVCVRANQPMSWFRIVLLIIFCSTARAIIMLPRNKTIPAVIMFGDSIVDTGNNNYIETIFKVNYPPYGKDFIGGKPTGRFCDGKVPSDLFVEELGIKELLPPYLDPTLNTNDLRTGVNFASGGAGFDPLTSELASVISLSAQIDLFNDYIAKLKVAVGEEITSTILSNSLFVVVAGSNDITNTYFNNPIRRLHYDISSYTDLMLNSASSFVKELYRLGARRIGVFGIPPIGCLPSQRTLVGGAQRKCAENYNQVAQLFNTKLSAELNSLNNNLPYARMVYLDVYNRLMELIHSPRKYGFEIANKGCCGTGTIEVAFLCKCTCSDVSDYVFWDSFHPTEKTYRILVHQALQKQITSFF